MTTPVKKHWLDCAIEIANFHVRMLKDESGWTIEKTATALNRSTGSVSQYILLASWSVTHEKQLRRYRSMSDALSFVRGRMRENKMREI